MIISLGKNVLKKLQNSDKLVMEVDLEKINIAAPLTTLSVLDPVAKLFENT